MKADCFLSLYASYGEAFEAQALIKGDKTAFRFLDSDNQVSSLTFAQLSARARQIAAGLQQHCQPGDRAFLIFDPGLQLIETFLGCLYAGVIAVLNYPPTNAKLSQKLEKIIRSATPTVVITTGKLAPRLADGGFAPHCRWATAEELVATPESQWQIPTLTPDAIGFLQFTSGSTGDPKGVMVSHRNILHNTAIGRDAGALHRDDAVVVSWVPPYHDMGLIGGVLTPLVSGASTVLMPPMTFMRHPLKWLKAIQTYRGTVGAGPSFAYDYCVDRIREQDKVGLDLSSWKCAINSAEPIHADTMERFYQAFKDCGFRRETFLTSYGLAEATLCASVSVIGQAPAVQAVSYAGLKSAKAIAPESDDDTHLAVSSGRPQLHIAIVDTAANRALAENEVGEIWVHGESVTKGYWNLEATNKEMFSATLVGDRRTYLRTGDLGFLRGGELYVTGRVKDLIIVHGLNYYPHDIERAAELSHPSLKPAGSCAFEYGDREKAVCVVAETQERPDGDLRAIVQAVRKDILQALGLSVGRVVLIRTRGLPKTTSGKVQRSEARRLLDDGKLAVLFDDAVHAAPKEATPQPLPAMAQGHEAIQRRIEQSLRQIMRLDDAQAIDPNAGFFDMGMDSLMAVTLMSQLQDGLGGSVSIDMDVIQAHGCVDSLAKYLHQATSSTAPAPAAKPVVDHRWSDFRELPSYVELQKQRQLFRTLNIDRFFLQEGGGLSANTVQIDGSNYTNFSSYNYLGLSGDPRVSVGVKQAVDRYGTSVSASRLVAGNKVLHAELEEEIAAFIGTEACVVLSAGHATNVNTITHLMGAKDAIFYDSLCHNSLIQGAVFSGAARFAFNHDDPAHLKTLLDQHRANFERVLILTEGVFSMDGDIPDIPSLVALKKRYACWLMVDEAHSIGTIGATGRGVCEHFNLSPHEIDILMGTLSKSFASCGGYVAGCLPLIDNLKYKSAGFVFSAGISPANAAAALESVRLIRDEPWRVAQVRANSAQLLEAFKHLGANTGVSRHTPVIPIIMDTETQTIGLSRSLRQSQVLALPILYPAVPRHLSRVRFFVSSAHTPADLERTVAAVEQGMCAETSLLREAA